MKLLIKVTAVTFGLVIALSGCARETVAGPISVTATPSATYIQDVDDMMSKAYYLVLSHSQVVNAAGSVVDGVIVINVQFVQGLSQQEQRSVLEVLAKQCADAVGTNVELTVVDDAGGLD